MKLYLTIVFEVIFLIASIGWFIPYCLNQSSDLWNTIGICMITVILPIDVARFSLFLRDEWKKHFNQENLL